MSDNITLPREVVEKAVKAFENGCPPTCEKGMIDSGGFHPWGEPALVPCPACLAFEHLRTALAAEQPKPEPVAYFDSQKQVFFWAKPTQIDVPMTVALEPLRLYTDPPEDEALRRENERLRSLLLRIRGWDHLDTASDGAFWKHEIDAALRREDV